jgi:hypothetical protein
MSGLVKANTLTSETKTTIHGKLDTWCWRRRVWSKFEVKGGHPNSTKYIYLNASSFKYRIRLELSPSDPLSEAILVKLKTLRLDSIGNLPHSSSNKIHKTSSNLSASSPTRMSMKLGNFWEAITFFG